jgi:putative endonuclease
MTIMFILRKAKWIKAMQREYYVYIMSNVSRTLYIGVTNDLERRVWEHKGKTKTGFTSRYNITLLVYIESYDGPSDAIAREKQLKRWSRSKKLAMIDSANPEWIDLSSAWAAEYSSQSAVSRR